MQQSPASLTSQTGDLIATFHHGKAFVYFTLIGSLFFLAVAGAILSLGSISPITDNGSASLSNSHCFNLDFSRQQGMIYSAAAFVAAFAVMLFIICLRQNKRRQDSYEIYELGITHVNGAQRDYTAFADIEDLYLFSSGKTATSGLVTNLAYRRNANESFHRVVESLKDFPKFLQLVCELQVRERLPIVLEVLNSGGSVAFKYIEAGPLWSKRISGNVLNITTKSMLLSKHYLEIDGQQVALSHLADLNLKNGSEKIVIKDPADKTLLSAPALAILSLDLFLTTLDEISAAGNS